jgi:hypothetical protein
LIKDLERINSFQEPFLILTIIEKTIMGVVVATEYPMPFATIADKP